MASEEIHSADHPVEDVDAFQIHLITTDDRFVQPVFSVIFSVILNVWSKIQFVLIKNKFFVPIRFEETLADGCPPLAITVFEFFMLKKISLEC